MYCVEKTREAGQPFSVLENGKAVLTMLPVETIANAWDPIVPATTPKKLGQNYVLQFLPITDPNIDNFNKFVSGSNNKYSDYVKLFENKGGIKETVKSVSEAYLAESIRNIRYDSAVGGLNLGLETEFINLFSMTHSPLEKGGKNENNNPMKCNLFGFLDKHSLQLAKSGKIDAGTLMRSVAGIGSKESRFVCIFLEHNEHVSTLVVDLVDRKLYSFDSLGTKDEEKKCHRSILPDNVVSLNNDCIQGKSGCGYISIKFATTLIETQNMEKAKDAAKNLGNFLMKNNNSLYSTDSVKKELGERFLGGEEKYKKILADMDKKKNDMEKEKNEEMKKSGKNDYNRFMEKKKKKEEDEKKKEKEEEEKKKKKKEDEKEEKKRKEEEKEEDEKKKKKEEEEKKKKKEEEEKKKEKEEDEKEEKKRKEKEKEEDEKKKNERVEKVEENKKRVNDKEIEMEGMGVEKEKGAKAKENSQTTSLPGVLVFESTCSAGGDYILSPLNASQQSNLPLSVGTSQNPSSKNKKKNKKKRNKGGF
ncbi:MAG: hypothetical protein LBU15_03910 [Rickettsiales bacterium]|jgi:hypothetical protein|nr:hypothetical protein [Rickettsiales bacterium]